MRHLESYLNNLRDRVKYHGDTVDVIELIDYVLSEYTRDIDDAETAGREQGQEDAENYGLSEMRDKIETLESEIERLKIRRRTKVPKRLPVNVILLKQRID